MKNLLIVLILVLFTINVNARMIEGVDVAPRGEIAKQEKGIWNRFKTKVVGIINRWTAPSNDRAPASKVEEEAPPPITLVDETPHFVAPVKGTTKEDVKNIVTKIDSEPLVHVKSPARAPVTDLEKNKFGVPVLELEKKVSVESKGKSNKKKFKTVRVVDKIPLLDIGEEAKLSVNEFTLPGINILKVDYRKYSELKSPDVSSQKDFQKVLGAKVVMAPDAIKIKSDVNVEGIGVVTLKKVEETTYKIASETLTEIKPIKEMGEEDLKFLRGLMLYVSGDKCHYASGIFFETRNSKKENLRDVSKFYLGDCLHKMGLFTQSIDQLIGVLKSSLPNETKAKAYNVLTQFPEDYNIEIGKQLEDLVEQTGVKPEEKAKAHYMVAAAALRRGSYSLARRHADLVPTDHNLFIRAQFIVALSEYNSGKSASGLQRLRKLQTLLPKEPVHKDLHALISLNLARMAFQEKQFDEASKYYLAIEKNHPLWITGLLERAWTQLMAGDNEGAIGNMFSLQSTYLKAVYRPESYIVRTIGYLNLCQYADAYKSLTLLEREYRPWISKINEFKQKHPRPVDYYNALLRYLSSPSNANVDGLPYQAYREIGRHRDFLNIQETINLKIDEVEQYKFIEDIAKKDFNKSKNLRAMAVGRLNAITNDLKLIADGKRNPKDENQLKMNRINEKNTIEFYDFQLSVFNEASHGFKNLKQSGHKQLVTERQQLSVKAGEILVKRLNQIQKDLLKYFENNEFMRYEVFAGSGENIRFHMTAGEDQKRIPSTAKPGNKELNWEFEGEFWEDEIGHYKTTLKDNCPQRAAGR